MSLINLISEAIFGGKNKAPTARESAKQRLHLVLINDRAGFNTPDFLPKLRQEIIEVLKKYVPIAGEDDVEVNIARKDETSIMELSVSLEGSDDKTDMTPFRKNKSDKAKVAGKDKADASTERTSASTGKAEATDPDTGKDSKDAATEDDDGASDLKSRTKHLLKEQNKGAHNAAHRVAHKD